MNILKKIMVLGVALTLSACAGSAKNQIADQPDETQAASDTARLTGDFSRSKLIAADFVATIAQIPATDPANTVLHTTRPSTRFGELLLGALQNAGFDLRIGSESSNFWLDYTASLDSQSSDIGNPVYTFIVAAGDVKLKRSYEVDQHGVWPAGSMFVRGADASNVVMDDSIFSIRTPKSNQNNQPVVVADNELDDGVTLQAVPPPKPFVKARETLRESTESVRAKRELQESVAALAPLRSQSGQLESPIMSAAKPGSSGDYSEFANMYETEESRYKEIFRQYNVVDSQVLVFPNDSLIMGKLNKQAIRQYADSFNPETDLISVIGCSHGASNLENGNGYLANGRAFRVKEEFVTAGFASDKILEEGCWANVDFPKMPARGVIVSHKRLAN